MPPRRGDLIIRDRIHRYLVIRVGNPGSIGTPCESLADALKLALETAPGANIWRENVDDRGRPLGPPIQIHPAPR